MCRVLAVSSEGQVLDNSFVSATSAEAVDSTTGDTRRGSFLKIFRRGTKNCVRSWPTASLLVWDRIIGAFGYHLHATCEEYLLVAVLATFLPCSLRGKGIGDEKTRPLSFSH